MDIKKLKRSLDKLKKSGGSGSLKTNELERFHVKIELPFAHTLEGYTDV